MVLNFIPLPGGTDLIVRIASGRYLRAPALALAALYRYGPSRTEARWRWISWGSAFATIVWLVVSVLFSWYVANFGSYDKTYGSLGAIIGFMTWIWISIIVVLVGAKLDAEMEHQTARRNHQPVSPSRSEARGWPKIGRSPISIPARQDSFAGDGLDLLTETVAVKGQQRVVGGVRELHSASVASTTR